METIRNLLSYDIPEMVDLKMEILLDRQYDVPEYFYDMINDDFVIRVTFSEPESEGKHRFIQQYSPRFRNYKYLVTYAIETGQLSKLCMFNPIPVARYCKRMKSILSEAMVDCMIEEYIEQLGYIPDCILSLRWNIQCGKFWFLMKVDSFVTEIESYIHHIESDYREDHIMPAIRAVFENISERTFHKLQERKNVVQLSDYYENGGTFLKTKNSEEDVLIYLEHTTNDGLLPEEIGKTLKQDHLLEYKAYIWEAIKKDPDNIRYIDWNIPSIRELDSHILSSNKPLTDFSDYIRIHRMVRGNVGVPNEVIINYIKSGIDINTMLDYIDILQYIPIALSYGKPEHIVELLKKDIHISTMVHTWNNSIFLNNYIVEHVFQNLGPDTILMVSTLFITNPEIWEGLGTESKNTILSMVNITELAKEYPQVLAIPSIFSMVSQMELRDICNTRPDAISYVPADNLPISLWKDTVRLHKYIKLQPHTTITGELVSDMVIRGYGYGYILDLPTISQQNAISKMYVLNRI